MAIKFKSDLKDLPLWKLKKAAELLGCHLEYKGFDVWFVPDEKPQIIPSETMAVHHE